MIRRLFSSFVYDWSLSLSYLDDIMELKVCNSVVNAKRRIEANVYCSYCVRVAAEYVNSSQ